MDQKSILKAAQEESKRTGVSVPLIIAIWGEEATFGKMPPTTRMNRYMIRRLKKIYRSTRRTGEAIGTAFKSILPRIQQK